MGYTEQAWFLETTAKSYDGQEEKESIGCQSQLALEILSRGEVGV